MFRSSSSASTASTPNARTSCREIPISGELRTTHVRRSISPLNLSGTFSPLSPANSDGYCLVKRTKICPSLGSIYVSQWNI